MRFPASRLREDRAAAASAFLAVRFRGDAAWSGLAMHCNVDLRLKRTIVCNRLHCALQCGPPIAEAVCRVQLHCIVFYKGNCLASFDNKFTFLRPIHQYRDYCDLITIRLYDYEKSLLRNISKQFLNL